MATTFSTSLAIGLALTACAAFPRVASGVDLSRFYGQMHSKRSGDVCHPYEPFRCPTDGTCISIQYLCDGAPDCQDGYDEDARLCTAANREEAYRWCGEKLLYMTSNI